MGLIETLKGLVELARVLDNAPLNREIIRLQRDALDLLQEKEQLASRVVELEGVLARRGALKLHDDDLYYVEIDGQERGPCCSACWTERGLFHRLLDCTHICPHCSAQHAPPARPVGRRFTGRG